MISQEREQLRRYYLRCWEKLQNQETMDGLEQQVADVIREHPEYHSFLQQGETVLGRDYLAIDGETNPFLHLSLHLGLREQVITNRPEGIQGIYQQLIAQYGVHEAEHLMMQQLAESLWLAQQNQTVPNEQHYLAQLQQLASTSKR